MNIIMKNISPVGAGKVDEDAKAKNLLLDHSCINCYYNDDWEHPHNGSLVRGCSNEASRRHRIDGVCDAWKETANPASIGISSRGWG